MNEELKREIEALQTSMTSNWKLRTITASPFIPVYKVAISSDLRDYLLRNTKSNVSSLGTVSVAVKLSELQKNDACELAVTISMTAVEWKQLPPNATTGLHAATSYGQVKIVLQGLSNLGTIDSVDATLLASYKKANEAYGELIKDGGYVGLDADNKPVFVAQTKA